MSLFNGGLKIGWGGFQHFGIYMYMLLGISKLKHESGTYLPALQCKQNVEFYFVTW